MTQQPMKQKRVLVVGAAGFLGKACTTALVAAGVRVDAVDILDSPVDGVDTWTVANVMSGSIPDDLFARAHTLINFVWQNDPGRGNSGMYKDVVTNVASAVGLFERAAQAGVKRLLYPSSGGTIYGDNPRFPTPETAPISPVGGYGAGKAAAELYLRAIGRAYGVETCALRIGNPYGPGQLPDRGQGFIATALARTIRGDPIHVFGKGELARDYLYVDDVAEAFTLACGAETVPAEVNVGSGRYRSIEQLLPLIFAATGRKTEVKYIAARTVDVPRVCLDIALIRETLNWRPRTTIEEGLRKTAEWLLHVGAGCSAPTTRTSTSD